MNLLQTTLWKIVNVVFRKTRNTVLLYIPEARANTAVPIKNPERKVLKWCVLLRAPPRNRFKALLRLPCTRYTVNQG